MKIYWYDAAQVPPYRPKELGENELLGDLPRNNAGRQGNANPNRQRPEQSAAPQDSNARLDAQVARAVSRGSNGSLFVGASRTFLE